MYEAAASCKDIPRAPVTNWKPLQDIVRRETRDFSHLLRYGVRLRAASLARNTVTLTCYGTVFCYKCGRAFKLTVGNRTGSIHCVYFD